MLCTRCSTDGASDEDFGSSAVQRHGVEVRQLGDDALEIAVAHGAKQIGAHDWAT
jgi:hypothetical protein